MNESRSKGKCNCLDDEPRRCYELKHLKAGEKSDDDGIQLLCSCPHANYLEGDIDLVKGGC